MLSLSVFIDVHCIALRCIAEAVLYTNDDCTNKNETASTLAQPVVRYYGLVLTDYLDRTEGIDTAFGDRLEEHPYGCMVTDRLFAVWLFVFVPGRVYCIFRPRLVFV